MKRKIWMASMAIVMLAGLNACCTIVPGKITYSDALTGTIEDLKKEGVDVKVAVFFNDKGQPFFYDVDGNRLKKCVLETPKTYDVEQSQTALMVKSATDTSSKDDDTPEPEFKDGDVCKGFEVGSAVTNVISLPIIRTNSSHCLSFGGGGHGGHVQWCDY